MILCNLFKNKASKSTLGAFFMPEMNYKNSKWKRKRNYILRRDHYLCQESKRYGIHIQADTVHHIYPAEFYPELRYIDWNLISLSRDVHNTLHDRTSHNLTKEGIELQKRFKPQYLKWCRDKGIEPHFEN